MGYLLSVLVVLAAVLVPEMASAGEIADSLCNLTSHLTGTTGKAIATITIAAFGIMALFGRTSWGAAFILAAGVALLFGATSVFQMLGGSAANCLPTTTTFTCTGGKPTPGTSLFGIDTISTDPTMGGGYEAPRNGLCWDPATQKMAPCTCVDPTTGKALPCESTCIETPQGQKGNCGIFARVLWMFKTTVGDIMGEMYCTFQNFLRTPLTVVLTLFVIVFGITVLTGMVNLTLKDTGIVLFKFALVWAFAMNAEWGVDIGYNFFIGFAEEGSNIVLSAMNLTQQQQAAPMTLAHPDTIFENILNSSTGTQSTISQLPLVCDIYLMIIGVFLLFFMPIIIIFIGLIVIVYIGMFARALLGYLTALVLITFLFVLAPFFLGFALFRVTMPLFEAWIKHLTGFSLQMVIMFGFLALLAQIPFFQFFHDLLNLLRAYSHTYDFGKSPLIASFPMSMCSICDYTIPPDYSTIKCVVHPFPDLHVMTRTQINATILNAMADAAKYTDQSGQTGYNLGEEHQYYVMSLPGIIEHTSLAKYVVIHALALYLICIVVADIMKKAPDIAASISQLPLAAALGGGNAPGRPKINFFGIESIQAAYLGFRNSLMSMNINPLRNPREFARRLNPRNMAKDWKGALTAATIGARGRTKQTTWRRKEHGVGWEQIEKVGKDGKPIYKREGGILGGFLRGAYENTPEVRRLQRQHSRAEDEVRAAKKEYERTGSEHARKRLERAEREERKFSTELLGHKKAGIFGRKDTLGSSSLNLFSGLLPEGHRDMEKLNKYRGDAISRSIYGRVGNKHESGYLGFMKIPQGVNPSENIRTTMYAMQREGQSKLEHLKSKLKNSNIPEHERKKIERKIAAAKILLDLAKTDGQVRSALADIDSLENKI